MLNDTVTLLCKSGLPYKHQLKVEAVIGVTIDENDVFIVHINESFSPQGGASSTSSAAAETSMDVVPFSQHSKRQFEAPRTPSARTPSSGVKRMRAESMPMSPSADLARQHAKQQLRFASPAKSPAGNAVRPPGLPVHAPGAMPHVAAVRRGSVSARVGARGSRRSSGGRGVLVASRAPHGMSRPRARASTHGLGRASPRQLLPGNRPSSSYDVKFIPGSTQSSTSHSHMLPSTATAADSSVGSFNFTAYPDVSATSSSAAVGDGHRNTDSADVPVFSTSGDDRYVNTVHPGFDFEGVFPLNSSNSSVQPGSFDDINPSLEFGFLSGFNASSSANGSEFAASAAAQTVSSSNIKTESLDDDVIFVDDDPAEPAAGTGTCTSSGTDDETVAGAAVQQITRRVTITTNIQGQNVKYEQVRLASRSVTQVSFSSLRLLNVGFN